LSYAITSFTHKNSSISFLEKIAFNDKDIIKFSALVLKNQNIKEIVILSTCNRVELIMDIDDVSNNLDFIFNNLSLYFSMNQNELEGHSDVYENHSAIHHIFCVSSSLESMVIGETQITGQLKSAFNLALEHKFALKSLSRIIHFSFKCSSAIRKYSNISKKPVSIASIAVVKLKDAFSILGENLKNKKAIVIGVGEMSKIIIKNLLDSDVNVLLFNRSKENAFSFKDEFNLDIEIKDFNELRNYINDINILFSATGSEKAIITNDMIDNTDDKKLWFDLALPKDIDIDTKRHNNIDISYIEDLEQTAKKNTSLREEEAQIAYSTIGQYVNDFISWEKSLDISPVISDLRAKAKSISSSEIKKALSKKYINEEDEANIRQMIHSIFNKFLHSPSVNLKSIANKPSADTVIDSLKFLFDLDSEDKKDTSKVKI